MKAILTLIAIIFFGTAAIAQNAPQELNVAIQTENVVLTDDVQKETPKETEVARLYKFKNSRIKKALAFRTKRNKSKLA